MSKPTSIARLLRSSEVKNQLIAQVETRIGQLEIEREALIEELTEIEGQIEAYDKTLHVTDHAVLRYMERALGMEVELVRQHMRRRAETQYVEVLDSARLPVDDVWFVVNGKTVVTVVNKE